MEHGSAIEAALEEQGERELVRRLVSLNEWEVVDLEDDDVTFEDAGDERDNYAA
jgi:hypothetical protein